MHSSRMCTVRSSSRLLGGGGCLPRHAACWDTHSPRCGPGDPPGVGLEIPPARPFNLPLWVWAWRPPLARTSPPPQCEPGDPQPDPSTAPHGCGPGDPPRPDPSTSHLGMSLETCKTCWDTNPPPPRTE